MLVPILNPSKKTSLEAAAVAEKRVLDLAHDYKLIASAINRTIAVDSKRLDDEICVAPNKRKIPAMIGLIFRDAIGAESQTAKDMSC
ncbi:hypothetical protein HZS_7144 [Henneguya salminicola]|nr:hypothetical protein HZS_7144 [Henneguya salminicola]